MNLAEFREKTKDLPGTTELHYPTAMVEPGKEEEDAYDLYFSPVLLVIDSLEIHDAWLEDKDGLVPPKKIILLVNDSHMEYLDNL